MGTKQIHNDNLRKLPNEYGDVSVMYFGHMSSGIPCLNFRLYAILVFIKAF